MDEDVTYVRDDEVETAFRFYKNDPVETQKAIKAMFRRLKFFTNNDFAFIDVHNERLFQQNSAVLLKIVKMLQDIRLKTNEENQFLGDMFEGFLDQGVKQSEGQFFTPMPIVKFIMNALPLDNLIAISDDIPKVIDYACGAGHFLNEYATSIRPTIENDPDKSLAEYYDHITGIEKEYRLSKVAKVSAFMYGQDDINIIYADALGSNENIKNNSYSVLVANPPYSVKGFLDTLKPSERRQYELLNYIDEKSYTVNNSIETFFIERAKQLLKTDGVAAIIVPSSILTKGKASSTSTSKNIYVATREILLKHFDIVAIAEFGSGTFGKTGTNTVTLFLRRKTTDAPVEADHYAERVNRWFNPVQASVSNNDAVDISEVFADSHFINDYCAHLELDADDYKTLLAGNPNQALLDSEYFNSYIKEFDKWSEIKNLKKRKSFKALSKDEQKAELNRRLVDYLKAAEQDKVYYFVLASLNPQPVLIIKSPSKTKEMKVFLGYEWSSAKGNEGIKYLGSVKVEDVEAVDEDSGEVALEEEDKRVLSNLYNLDNIHTPLYNPKDKHDANKINHLINQNFQQEQFLIPEELEPFVTKARLVDMLDFSVIDFNKAISLTPKVDFTINTKWDLLPLGSITEVVSGGTPDTNTQEYWDDGDICWATIVDTKQKYIHDTARKITQLGLENSSAKLLPIDTVIFSSRATIGEVAINKVPLATNQGFKNFICNEDKITYQYLYYLLVSLKEVFEMMIPSGTKYKEINTTDIRSFRIPVPPLDIQREIASACQKVDDKVKKAQNQTVEFTNEINKLISESAHYTNSQKTKIGSVLDLKAGKFVPASDIADDYHESLYPCYGGNGLRGYTKTFTHEGDYCLIGRQGALCGNITRVLGKFHATEHAVVVTPLIDMNDTWLYYKLVSLDLNQYATGVAQPGLSVKNLNNLPITIIPIEEQSKVAKEIQILESKLNEAQAIIDTSSDKKHVIIESYL
ncbi:restriction endonuclease subunit S [Psychrobacter sp. Cmf 22.2]|uniref:restriction endonuclease subunit S n=1 Tax=Psychrobacter sp. Cmf 22.2 TaxID=1926478 RepID=UPI000AE3B63B|nr:restriction endonuclease subunit S [Psychrobacter sp. Cmf 22.2]